jgi:PKD repeat protein
MGGTTRPMKHVALAAIVVLILAVGQLSCPGAELPLVADFVIGTPKCASCAGIELTDRSTGGVRPYLYHWDFGDGEHSSEHEPTHYYRSGGDYAVTLTLTDRAGNVASKSDNVKLYGSASTLQTGWPRCQSGCTAKDTQIVDIWLVANPDCIPGTPTTAELWASFEINRAQGVCCIVAAADIYIDGVLTEADYVSHVGDLFPGGTYDRKIKDITWPCGSALTLMNIHVQWIDKGGQPCASCQPSCDGYLSSKCQSIPGPFEVTTPLIVYFDVDFEFDEPCFCNDTIFTDGTTGGVEPYTWHWDFGDDSSSALQNPTHHYGSPGTYTVTLTVTDSDSPPLVRSGEHEVTVSPRPSVNAGDSQELTCTVTAVNLTATASGGTSPYTYSWKNSDDTEVGTEEVVTVFSPDTYTVTVTDTNGCSASDAVVVTQDAAVPSVDIGPDRELTCAVTEVTLSATVSGGTPPYSYSWKDSSDVEIGTSQQIAVISPDTYFVTVTDANGCCSCDSVVVAEDIESPSVDAGPDQELTCALTEVTLSAAVSGGTPPYSYSWKDSSDLEIGTTAQVTVTAPNTYTVTVTGANGCFANDSVLVTQDTAAPIVNAGPDQELTCTVTAVTLTATASGGAVPYTYMWRDSSDIELGTTEDITVLWPDTYTVAVTGANGCTASDAVVVTQDDAVPSVDIGPDRELTCAVTEVTLSATVSGGTPPYSYSWKDSSDVEIGTSQQIAVISPDTYFVTVTDANGCCSCNSVVVTQDPAPCWCVCGFVYLADTTQGLAGWEIVLEKKTSPWVYVDSTLTDADGKYCFCGLESGEYRISQVIKPGWTQVAPLPNEYVVILPGDDSDPEYGPFLDFENEQSSEPPPLPPLPPTVGWQASSVDRLAVMWPWVALLAAIIVGVSLLVLRRRRALG